MSVTKTIGPLHFEDLEPHRFEDLVRQVIYEFKDWVSLEATGRSGSDDGFDARGTEKIHQDERLEDESEGEDENSPPIQKTNIWLIQCKRQKEIGPKEIETQLTAIKLDSPLHGIIFAAACDFSKKTRDVFITKIREMGVSEGYLWGKAELEDILFQPKNDHLLFAYFGISLSIRRRSVKSTINSKLAIKRKLIRILGSYERPDWQAVLLRDINDTAYPYWGDVKGFRKRPSWILRAFMRYYHDGIEILEQEFLAYSIHREKKWDYYNKVYSKGSVIRRDPWEDPKVREEEAPLHKLAHDFWFYKIPEANKAWFRVYRQIPFEKIIAIDEHGDNITSEHGKKCPHIFLPFDPKNGPYNDRQEYLIEPYGRYNGSSYWPKKDNKIKFFPDPLPEISQEERDALHKDPKNII